MRLTGRGHLAGEVNDMWYWHGMGTWGCLVMIAFWAVLILLIVWTFRMTKMPRKRDEKGPLRILDERLARGEIDREDYEERRRVLESGR